MAEACAGELGDAHEVGQRRGMSRWTGNTCSLFVVINVRAFGLEKGGML